MAEPRCGSCKLRARHDRNPRSFWGRLWRWHTRFCPGWKRYLHSLPEIRRQELLKRYPLQFR